jgi:hypothetical protein
MVMEMSKEAKKEEKQTTTEMLLIHFRRIDKRRLQKLALQLSQMTMKMQNDSEMVTELEQE